MQAIYAEPRRVKQAFSPLTLVYVIEPLLQDVDLTWTIVDKRIPKDVSFDTAVLFGKSFVEIPKYERGEHADLIVTATNGRGAISHILMGSTAEKFVRKASGLALMVKHPKQVFVMP